MCGTGCDCAKHFRVVANGEWSKRAWSWIRIEEGKRIGYSGSSLPAEEIQAHAIERQLNKPAAYGHGHEFYVCAGAEFAADKRLTIWPIQPDTSTRQTGPSRIIRDAAHRRVSDKTESCIADTASASQHQ